MTWLVVVAAFGLLVPNGLFVYWLLVDYTGLTAVLDNTLALAFMLEALLLLVLLTIYFARRPIGRVGWGWFVALSVLGGLGFGLPFYYWLNARKPAV
jgi:hypothetical protein